MRFPMAAWTSFTMVSASAFTEGGKTLATKTWPSASPRSSSVQRTQRFQRGASSFAPRSVAE